MHGPAVARWVRRHPEDERFLAALECADEAVQLAAEQVRRRVPGASLRDIRKHWARQRSG